MFRTKDYRVQLANRKEIRQIEYQMQDQCPNVHLMSNAAKKATAFIEKHIMPYMPIDSILFLIGPGNNGGDGIYVASYLAEKGFSNLKLCIFGEDHNSLLKRKLSQVPAYQIEIFTFENSQDFWQNFQSVSLVVDGLFGVGLSRNIEGDYAHAIHKVNQSLLPVLSLDAPSGLNCNTGRVLGVAIEAQWTVTFGLAKPGFYIWDGPRTTGELHCLDIGFLDSIVKSIASSMLLFDQSSAACFLPKRSDTNHKAKNGRVCVVAGQKGMWGAGILACSGAFRVGAGYTTLANREDPSLATGKLPEMLTRQFSSVTELLDPLSAIAIGPGLGVGEQTKDIILELLKLKVQNVVVDADALTTLSQMRGQKLDSTWLLTPHSGEMARLLDNTVAEVDRDRIQAVKECSALYGCHVMLKGYKTLVGYHDQRGFKLDVINSGNASLATAGTGDVLCGMIAGFVAQGLDIQNSGALGSFLHGTTADVWVKKGKAKHSMMASDVLNLIPEAFSLLKDDKNNFV